MTISDSQSINADRATSAPNLDRKLQISNRKFQSLCWHGWRIELPARWNPVKVEGDESNGYLLVADLHRERLGLRWSTPKAKEFDAVKSSDDELRQEVGRLAADEARAFKPSGDAGWSGAMLYLEPHPPGRDVWVGHSSASGRSLVVVHHARRRERILPDVLLPMIRDMRPDADANGDATVPWSIFDLNCLAPADMKLEAQVLNVGDLNLSFVARRNRKRRLGVRQLSIASVALARQPLERWLAQHQDRRRKHYRVIGTPEPTALETADGRSLEGFVGRLVRRRRFCFMRSMPREYATVALHDTERDRVVIVQATDEHLARAAAATVGHGV